MKKKLVIPAIRLHQWLPEWDKVQYNDKKSIINRRKPEPYLYMFSIKASLLRRLGNVYRRSTGSRRYIDPGHQRQHEPSRSEEIAKFVVHGYPLSEMLRDGKVPIEYDALRMPGWLPTAILANILAPNTKRGGNEINSKDLVNIVDDNGSILIELPEGINDNWQPTSIHPIEIIDGQHRLWSFDKEDVKNKDFELPVIAFYGLDITWQAYLFYTINVKPKKINRSLAFDLYPILRIQEWLEKSADSANVYRETRAQEIVEMLWSYSESPWKNRINMLGELRSNATITQAAFIRNVIASFIKHRKTGNVGGLFGSSLNHSGIPLGWNRLQQASFMIFIWRVIFERVNKCSEKWAKNLRSDKQTALFGDGDKFNDPAFFGPYSLISTDQGVRGYLHIINDFCFINARELGLDSIKWPNSENLNEIDTTEKNIEECINTLAKSPVSDYVNSISKELVRFNWTTSSEPNLTLGQKRNQMLFKGSSGYKEIRTQLLDLLIASSDDRLSKNSELIKRELGYAG